MDNDVQSGGYTTSYYNEAPSTSTAPRSSLASPSYSNPQAPPIPKKSTKTARALYDFS